MTKEGSSTGDRGQAYTLEAVIAATLVITVVLFIAPSFATPTSDVDLEQTEREAMIEEDAQALLDAHHASGWLKHVILDYSEADEAWNDDRDGSIVITPPEGDGNHLTIPDTGDFWEDLSQFENRHNVSIRMYIVPESIEGNDDPERALFLLSGDDDHDLASASVSITLYDDDRLQSPVEAHTRDGAGLPQHTGDGERLKDSDYIIEPNDVDDGNIYNTVTVRMLVVDDTRDNGGD